MKLSGKLARTVRFFLGFAAMSGVAIAFSSTAMAADARVAGVASGPVTSQSDAKPVREVVREAAKNMVTTIVAPVETGTNEKKLVDQTPTVDVLAAPTTEGVVDKTVISKSMTDQPLIANSQDSTDQATKDKSTLSGPVSLNDASSQPTIAIKLPAVASVEPVAETRESGVIRGIPAPVAVAVSDTSRAFYRSVKLVIQPTITARPQVEVDLATALPSSPARNDGSEPTRSHGLLGQLTAELAGTVVPALFALFAPMVARQLSGPLNAAALYGLLGLTLVTLSYGLWLRRSGFVNAARSDMAALRSLATPFRWDYVLAVEPLHSLHFCDGVRQQNGYSSINVRKGRR